MKGQKCTGPECDREQMVRFDLCPMHRKAQREGRPLTRFKNTAGAICTFEGCDRIQMDRFDLCGTHRIQQTQGKALTPIGSTKNVRTYPADAVCEFEGCDNPRAVKDWCHGHYSQYKTGRILVPLGTIKERNEMSKRYSETMTCAYCGGTKSWKLFIMGTDHRKKTECKECYFDRMHPPEEDKTPMTSEQLLEAVFGK